jgi:hypothetical protein
MIGGKDLHPVEAAFARPRGRVDKAGDHLLDFCPAHGVRHVRVVVGGQPGRRPAGPERVVEVAMLADMVELLDHHRIVGVAGFGDGAEAGDHRVVIGAEVAAGEHRRRVDRHRLDDDHRRAADRPLEIVGAVLLARQAIARHVGRVGTEHDAVLQPPRSKLKRCEEVAERRHRGLTCVGGAVA